MYERELPRINRPCYNKREMILTMDGGAKRMAPETTENWTS